MSMSIIAIADHPKVERLIHISKHRAIPVETFVPWNTEPSSAHHYISEEMISLQGHPLWETLSDRQKIELGKHEVVQVMYSYAWSEGMACYFFNRRLLQLSPDDIEYRFLIREIIEEFQHQEMFARAIKKCDGQPVMPTGFVKWLGAFCLRFAPDDLTFMSVMAVELLADIYGKKMRQDDQIYPVLRKVSELHHIEEGRHIYYAKLWLQKFTKNAGIIRRSIYSIYICTSIIYMREQYVRKDNFERIGIEDSRMYCNVAKKNFRIKFGKLFLEDAISFVEEIRGFNPVTKWIWRKLLKANI
jgi:hypothetical protein